MIDYLIPDEDERLIVRPKKRARLQDVIISVAHGVILIGGGLLIGFGVYALRHFFGWP